MTDKLNSLALGTSAAIVAGLSMLILGILGNLGIYQGAVEMMSQWHMFFSLSPFGILTGIIEAALISFAFLYIFGWLYNKFTNPSESIEGGD
jgi:hypothetical protein